MRTVLLVLYVALAIEPSAIAMAQQSDGEEVREAPAELRPDTTTDVDEITITGTRTDVTDIQNESTAISAFSMAELDRAEIVNVDKLAMNVPSLHVGQVGSESIITLRGIGTENASITGEPGLQFHVDGVNYARPSAARVAFFDLEGLQVERGPTGFEGGKNATAGAIRVHTRKPHGEYEATGDFQWGSFDQRRVRAAVNVPLSEYVQTRFAMLYDNRDGYQKNFYFNDENLDAFDADDFGWRGHVRLLPHEDLDILFSYNDFQQEGVGPGTELQVLPFFETCSDFGPGRIRTQQPPFAACAGHFEGGFPPPLGKGVFVHEPASDNGTAGTPNTVYKNRVTRQDNRFWGWTMAIDWQVPVVPLLGDTELKSITSYQVFDLKNDGDRDATDLDAFWGAGMRETDQWYQEFQLRGGALDKRIDWQLSLLHMRETSESSFDVRVRSATIRNVDIDQEVENKSYGVALNSTWHAMRDLSLTMGGRYIRDQKRDKLLRDNPPGIGDSFNTPFAVCTGGARDLEGRQVGGNQLADGIPDDPVPTCSRAFRHVAGSLKLEWTPIDRLQWWPTEETLIYASVSNGFKSGGFAAFQVGVYEPEYIWSFAGGAKNTFWGDRITLNAETYFYRYRDLQIVVLDGISIRTDNLDAEIYGWELEWDAEPLSGLHVNGQLSYTNSEVVDYMAYDPADDRNAIKCVESQLAPHLNLPCEIGDWSGNQLSRAPEWSYTIGAEYMISLGRFGSLTPRIQYYWQDDTWYRAFNRTPANSGSNSPLASVGLNGDSLVNDLQESYHHTDIKLRWRSLTERWAFETFVLNLEDNEVYQNVFTGSAALGHPGFAWYGPPRTYGFRFELRY